MEKQVVQSIISEFFPIQLEEVGDKNASKLIDSVLEETYDESAVIPESESERNFDYEFAIKVIAEITSIIKILFDYYKFKKEQSILNKSEEEIEHEIMEKKGVTTKEQRKKVVKKAKEVLKSK
jgi:hypothetical protein